MASTTTSTRPRWGDPGDGGHAWKDGEGPSVEVYDPEEDSAEVGRHGVPEEPTLDTPRPAPSIERRRAGTGLRLDTACDVDDIDAIERLTLLVHGLRNVLHPGVVAPIGLVPAPQGGWAIASPRVEGVELGRLIRHGPIDPAEALALIAEVAEALEFAWAATDERGAPLHLTHGALALDRLVIDVAGQVRIQAFGVARATRGPVDPESAAADDIYALGAIAWQLCTADAVGPCLPEALSQARRVAMVERGLRERGVPVSTSALLARCLAFEPAFRPSRVELMSGLRSALVPVPTVEAVDEEPEPEEATVPLLWKPGWAVVLGLLFGLVVLGAWEGLPA